MEQGGRHSGGFTIIETMIVLSVSAILAVSALVLVNGRQNKTQFQVAANNLQQRLQQIINETVSGYYPNNSTFMCTTPSSIPVITPGSAAQGTNNECIFVGKALSFGGGGSLQDDQMVIYPLVANRQTAAGAEVSKYAVEARIMPVMKGSIAGINNNIPAGSTVTDNLGGGLTFKSATYTPTTGAVGNYGSGISVFGILTSLSTPGSGGLDSGAQHFGLYGFPFTPPSGVGWKDTTQISPGDVADAIYKNQDGIQPLNSVSLCFDSGTTKQSASITIGDPLNGGTGVSLQIHNGVCP